MTQPAATTERAGITLEALQTQTQHTRRPRPPDLEVMTGGRDRRVPLNQDVKVGKRESRIGLRGLFGRSRAGKDGDVPLSPRDSTRTPGSRTSWVDLGSWSLQPQRLEPVLPTVSDVGSAAEAGSPSHPRQKKPPSAGKKSPSAGKRPAQAPVRTSRVTAAASWDPPPLFQAYPQAIRHAHLPACTSSADAILRMNEKRSAREDAPQEEGQEDAANDKSSEKKRRHRRSPSSPCDWTTKVYVLVTSGYLLQYTGEGSFDRLPEKVLHLGKDSAAFASDVIPGRHWVLQVASTMDGGGPAPDSRSLLSRLPFRSSEKRHASNFLMVFEGAADMEGWISVLRKEIEALGGKKNLSETGKPKAEGDRLQLKAQVSQRTLVVRDPERFSRVISPQELAWQYRQSMPRERGGAGSPVTVVEFEATPEPSLDDISTTNSVVSHDGRQLDNLRDSTGANRLSYMSSGQRTIVTSAGSSPACSPMRESFASYPDDPSFPSFRELAPPPEVRLRPNAAAIADRRQSMLAMSPFVDPKPLVNPHRPQTTYAPALAGDAPAPFGPTTLNFSVPHAVSRRYSLAKPVAALEAAAPAGWSPPPPPAPEQPAPPVYPPRASSRRCPPAGLIISRRLSIVADQPSPILEFEPPTRPPTSHSRNTSSTEEAMITLDVKPPAAADPADDLPVQLPCEATAAVGHAGDVVGHRVARVSRPHRATSIYDLRDPIVIPIEGPSAAMADYVALARRVAPAPPSVPSINAMADYAVEARRAAPTPPPIPSIVAMTDYVVEARSAAPTPPPIPSGTPEVIRRCRSSTDHYDRSRSRSPSVMHAKRASLNVVTSSTPPEKRRARLSLPNGSDISLSPSTLTTLPHSAPSLGAVVPATSGSPPSGRYLTVDKQSRSLFNRRSMPQLADGPPPAPPPTCALPPIPQSVPPPTCALPPIPQRAPPPTCALPPIPQKVRAKA